MFLTLVLAGCGIAGGIIAYFQWGALKEQVGKLGEAIKAETDAGKARAEENAAALATANAANEIAREIGQAQTRAYLSMEGGTFVVERDSFRCSPFIRNYAQSPALDVRLKAVVHTTYPEYTDHPQGRIPNLRTILSEPFHNPAQPVPAGGKVETILLWVHGKMNGGHEKLRDRQSEAFFSVSGRMEWDDVFEKPHSADFTLMFDTGVLDLSDADDDMAWSGPLLAHNYDPKKMQKENG